MLDITLLQTEENGVKAWYNSKEKNAVLNVSLLDEEIKELKIFGQKVLSRFAFEIMQNQVKDDNYRNGLLSAVDFVNNPQEIQSKIENDPNQMELAIEKPKRKRRTKEEMLTENETTESTPIAINNQITNSISEEENEDTSLNHPLEVGIRAKSKNFSIEDLRNAAQDFMVKNGRDKISVDNQTAKLTQLFTQYGGSNVSTFPKNKIGEVLEKMKNL